VAQVLAPDLRGHGDSQAVAGPYSMDMFADDMNAFLSGLNITQPVVVCGLSMGGYIALAFYRKYARSMAGLILTSTRAGPDSPEAKSVRQQTMTTVLEKGKAVVIDNMALKLLSPENVQQRPDLMTKAPTIMDKTSPEGILGDLAGMRDRIDSTPMLKDINVPTLVIHGAEDAIIPLSEAQIMAETIPGALLKVIPRTGHLPNLENPRAFNLAVKDFLKRLKD
jgi:3-oxoadipate enol-lactonase